MSDLLQSAVAKCLAADYVLDACRPYDDRRVRKAARHLKIDDLRKSSRESARVKRWSSEYSNRERIDPERRYTSGKDDPVKVLMLREQVALLQKSVSRLEARQRDVVIACDFNGQDPRTYAESHHLTLETVRSLRYRGYQKMKIDLS